MRQGQTMEQIQDPKYDIRIRIYVNEHPMSILSKAIHALVIHEVDDKILQEFVEFSFITTRDKFLSFLRIWMYVDLIEHKQGRFSGK